MVKSSELKEKEVINISDGARLGFVYDVEVNMESGIIESIIVPGNGKFLGMFGKNNDYVIPWNEIKIIGTDIILVDIKNTVNKVV